MYIDVNGIRLKVECHGEGPDLIMLHGNGEDMDLFRDSIGSLEKDFKVWLIDSRGHGGSSGAEVYHYADMAMDVICAIGELGIRRPVLFGYSDGGIIGLLVAIMEPDMLSGLITAGANTDPSMLEPSVYEECRQWNEVHRDPRMTMMLTEPHITTDDLSGIRTPTVVMAGSEDCILREDTDRIADNIPCSRKVILQGHDHSSYIEDGTLLPDIIREAYGHLTAL